MLKKILGEAPFGVELEKEILVSPDRKVAVKLLFSNESEYDFPLSCNIKMPSSLGIDKTAFDITLPAEGKTQMSLVFSYPKDSRIFGGIKICELEIADRIFDSKTLYEFEVRCEAAYKCCDDAKDAFEPTEEVFFTSDGVVFANEGEVISFEIPTVAKETAVLHIISGKIKGFGDGDIITLTEGLNRLCFEMTGDGSFEFLDVSSEEKIYPDTLNTKYFL